MTQSGPVRRSFLRGLLGAGAATAAAGYLAGSAEAATASSSGSSAAVPFHGPHQAAILMAAQPRAVLVAFDLAAASRGELTDIMQAITSRARFLTTGGVPAPTGVTAPPSDTGMLGPDVVPDGLTVTVGVGASLFDERYGLGPRKPARLTTMVAFPDDTLDPAQCGGDLSLLLAANSTDTVLHALRDITQAVDGGMQVRWRIDGFSNAPRPSGAPRNLMGFKDGISNPDAKSPAQMDELVWVPSGASGEPAWTSGGSYQVIRLIRMFVEFWDRISLSEQEHIFGRRRADGAPLDANSELDVPGFAANQSSTVIPLDAHIRLANPRTPQSAGSRILRRGFNYDRGTDAVGDLDMGLIFTCYQRDPQRQFETVQGRLAGEPLVDYISPFGGGYFFALPGVSGRDDYFGRALLA